MRKTISGILITGISGFVGSYLTPYLCEKGENQLSGLIREDSNVSEDVRKSAGTFLTIDELNHKHSFSHYIHLAGKAHDLKGVSDEQEYFDVNYGMTKQLFDHFVQDSDSESFIFMSSVKAVSDSPDGVLDETAEPNPITAYGRSKLKAEEYILENCPKDKKAFILRPCMIHGPGNKGNLNLLYSLVSKGIPWPLGRFDNSRSFLSIENLCFVIHQIMEGKLSPGIYQVADSETISTNQLIHLISKSSDRKARIINTPKTIIKLMAKAGNILPLPLDEERLQKLTEDYVVSNRKLVEALGEELPVSAVDGLGKTLESF